MDKGTWAIVILGLALLLAVLYLITLVGPFIALATTMAGGIGTTFLILLGIVIILAVAFTVAVRVKVAYY